jgi:hypothetical protein
MANKREGGHAFAARKARRGRRCYGVTDAMKWCKVLAVTIALGHART